MMAIVSFVTVRAGSEGEWYDLISDNLESASRHPGFVRGQVMTQTDEPTRRCLVGTWRSRADQEEWINSPELAGRRERLQALQEGPATSVWHEVARAIDA
jgi:quinol monooxygenase YgiN